MNDDFLQKIVADITFNHRKIIDDWCKAYLAQIYEEEGSIKPGDFTLFEQDSTDIKKFGKKYWFEKGKPNFPKYDDWIRVKDQLPTHYEYVIVYGKKEGTEPSPISIARQYKGKWEMMSNEDQSNAVACGDFTWGIDGDEITHWMALPKPPYSDELYELGKMLREDYDKMVNTMWRPTPTKSPEE